MPNRFHKKHIATTLITLLITAGVGYALNHRPAMPATQPPISSDQSIYAPPTPSKTGGCIVANALPDPLCTPGAAIPAATKAQICVSGYSSTVRNVPATEKDAVYAEYNIPSHAPGEYEVDHLISLELGGSNDIANLWPEAASPTPGFHQKDVLENELHAKVCAGTMSLSEAQKEIATNWLQFYTAK